MTFVKLSFLPIFHSSHLKQTGDLLKTRMGRHVYSSQSQKRIPASACDFKQINPRSPKRNPPPQSSASSLSTPILYSPQPLTTASFFGDRTFSNPAYLSVAARYPAAATTTALNPCLVRPRI